MFNFHTNKNRYFNMQKWVTSEHIIPYLESEKELNSSTNVLEIGCGEAGVLAAFLEKGCSVVGIELSDNRAIIAREHLSEAIADDKAAIMTDNIYDVDPSKRTDLRFDVIVLKDVIEHIPDQEKFIPVLKSFLKPEGVIFFAYPPWWMPFGGHQQLCNSKVLSKLPWFHLLPMSAYKGILKMFKEPQGKIDALEEVKETGITIERLHRILRKEKFDILKQTYWLINPIYVKKFGIKPIKQWFAIPYIRNVISTCHYIIFKPQ